MQMMWSYLTVTLLLVASWHQLDARVYRNRHTEEAVEDEESELAELTQLLQRLAEKADDVEDAEREEIHEKHDKNPFVDDHFINRGATQGPTTLCGRPAVQPTINSRIVGGRPAVPYSFPWQCAIINNHGNGKIGLCGGSVISELYILSAAHCVFEEDGSATSATRFTILCGLHTLSPPERTAQKKYVSRIIPHPQYNGNTMRNDIAIFQLSTPLDLTTPYVKPVCLPYSAAPAGTQAVVTGWGNTAEDGDISYVLMQVVVPITTQQQCGNQPVFQQLGGVPDTAMCAGYAAGGKDSCQGDSGGPLVCLDSRDRWVQQGVVSFGDGCAERNKPGVYTRVLPYMNWIYSITGVWAQ